jgi:DNA-binding Lrp family transcriptional regulator
VRISKETFRVLEALIAYTERNGRNPALEDIATLLKRKPPTVWYHTERLVAAGYLEKLEGTRNLRILKRPDGSPYPYLREEPFPGVRVSYQPQSAEQLAVRSAAQTARELGRDDIADEILRRAGLL